MVHFFGILHPGSPRRRAAAEAPAKASFFGGEVGSAAVSRLEWEAFYLSGKAPEPDAEICRTPAESPARRPAR
ncbi:MAG: hypothetical protein KIS86_11950 [Devosia sp.]|nr:hypothetical protein [Devosia sp.]